MAGAWVRLADEDAEAGGAGAGVRRGAGDPGVQVGGRGDGAGRGGRAPFGDRDHAGRDQGQAAKQGGDLGVAARGDPGAYAMAVQFMELRERRGLTQAALAAATGLDQADISWIESGAA